MDVENVETYFGIADFVVFFASLLVSALIGVYFGYKDKNKKSIETYYYGDRRVSPLAVAMSMSVSFVSAITVIGFPVEAYFYGIVFLWWTVGMAVGTTFGAVYFIPFIFRLQMKSVFEFLELRYNRMIRRLCSGVSILQLIIYMGTTVFLPALALNSVTPLDLEWSIALTSFVCTFYSTLGGIKAVIWTDVLQGSIMVFGSISLFIKATMDVGGINNVINATAHGGRLNFFDFGHDIRERTSPGSYFMGVLVLSTNGACFSQVYAQRYLSCKSVTTARTATFLRVVFTSIFLIIAALNGLAMYAFYLGCDPYKAGYITKKDQLTPRFAVEAFRTMPGVAGLFVAAAYSGTLSTVSSGINSLAAITTEDFINPRWPELTGSKKACVAKIFTALFGCLVTGFAYLISLLKSTMIQISISLSGIFAGPMFAVFLAGSLCPWVNEKGALGGMIIGWALCAWCSLGRIIYGAPPEFSAPLPVSTDQCVLNTTSISTMETGSGLEDFVTTAETVPYRPPLADTLYAVSPYLYGFMGFVVAITFMLIISGFTGFHKPCDIKPELFVPLVDNKKCFPAKVLKFFRFGVPELPEKQQHEEELPLQEMPKS